MKKVYYTLVLGVSILLLSCYTPENIDLPINENIVIDLGATTRASDDSTESYVDHIDIFVFKNGGGTPTEKAHYERQHLNNSRTLTLNATRSSFNENEAYYLYLVANSNIDQATFSAMSDYNALLNAKQEDPLLYLAGLVIEGVDTPRYFLMDAVAEGANGEKAIVINNKNITEALTLSATLRRAAAKVVVSISAGENIVFKNFPESDGLVGASYYVNNLPYDAFLLAEAKSDEDIEAQVRNTSRGSSKYFVWSPDSEPKKSSLTVYAYPNHWSNTSILEHESCIVMNLPMAYTEGGVTTDYHNNWYKIPMTDDQTLRRNNFYDVQITINRPGASSATKPVDITDISYEVEEWVNQSINVGGEDKPKYLMVNRKEMEMHNETIDSSTLEFASSSPVTISIKRTNGNNEVYYYNKYGDKVYENLNITGSTNGGIAGNITIDTKQLPSKNAIRYFTLVVTNQDGLSKEVSVAQYPLVYITNILSHYAYRSDFLGNDTSGTATGDHYENRSSYSRFAVNYTNGAHSYNSGGSDASGFFVAKVVGATYSSGNYKGLARVDYYTSNRQSTFRDNYNPRMYHIRITSTSSEYVLGRPKITNGVTDPGEDNANMVSPSFMIASRVGSIITNNLPTVNYSGIVEPNPTDYGATKRGYSVIWPTGSNKAGYDAAYAEYEAARAQRVTDTYHPIYAEHAKQYVEVYKDPETGKTVHLSDWRLPTRAELEIIYKFQGSKSDIASADAIDFLLNGSYYMSASGFVYNSNNDTSGYGIRCIRDVY